MSTYEQVLNFVFACVVIFFTVSFYLVVFLLPSIWMWLAWKYVAVSVFAAPSISFPAMILLYLALRVVGIALFPARTSKKAGA